MYKVIVGITTYNLEKYISEALDSVLNQKTNFNYKVIVADDCSTDRTLEILHKYKDEYPDILEILTTSKNMGSLANSNRIFNGLQCEYFAFLDGDDYWVNSNSLQKQVDFLDNHKEYMMCAGNTQYLRNGLLEDFVIGKSELNKSYCFDDYVNKKMPFVHTSAILVRNKIFINGLPRCFIDAVDSFENCALRGEDFRRILHLEKGPIFVYDEVFSVYRIHDKGMWQGSSRTKQFIESTIVMNFYMKYFGEKYGNFFSEEFRNTYKLMMLDLVLNKDFMNEINLDNQEANLLANLIIDLSGKGDVFKKGNKKTFKHKLKRKLIKFALAIK